MASPLGHSLAGLIIYKIFYRDKKLDWLVLLIILALANLPDLDFIPGFLAGSLNRNHHGVVHSVGFILVAAPILALIFKRPLGRKFLSGLWIIFVILAVHLLIDFFTLDLSPPYGGKFIWPLSNNFYTDPWPLFPPFWRDSWGDVLTLKNLRTIGVEGLVLGLILFLVTRKFSKHS